MTDLEVAVQLLGGDTNKVFYDDAGLPSIMVRFDKGTIASVLDGGSENTHHAFSVDGVEKERFWYSKYQNVRILCGDGLYRAYSLPLQDPQCVINFDNSRIACENKGAGWHLATNAEWAWIALQCRKNGFMPRGNNNYGQDGSRKDEKGIPTYYSEGKIARVATGSGPKSWAHNNDASGVWDLNGNVLEWIGGYRTVAGEIQIIPYNNAANRENPQTVDSTFWKAIMPDGSLVDPGTAGTLKWDYANSKITLATELTLQEDTYKGTGFVSLGIADGIVCPEVMKALALFPADANSYGSDYFYMNNGAAERLAYRGGNWSHGSNAGVFFLDGHSARSLTNSPFGFRSAFVEL